MAVLVIFGTMVLVVLAAKWQNTIDPKGTDEKATMLNTFLGFVIFVGIWFQCFIFACSKFVIGYVVGVWYFSTCVEEQNLV